MSTGPILNRRSRTIPPPQWHTFSPPITAYPAAATEAWLDGHNRAFAFFGGIPQSILYDNDKCLVSRILPDGTCASSRP